MSKRYQVYIDDSLADLVPFFVEETMSDLNKMQSAIAKKDFKAVSELAHTLKGESGGYGFNDLGQRAEDLEDRARNRDHDSCQKLYSEMIEILGNFEVIVQSGGGDGHNFSD